MKGRPTSDAGAESPCAAAAPSRDTQGRDDPSARCTARARCDSTFLDRAKLYNADRARGMRTCDRIPMPHARVVLRSGRGAHFMACCTTRDTRRGSSVASGSAVLCALSSWSHKHNVPSQSCNVALSARMCRVPEVVGRCDQRAERTAISFSTVKSLYRATDRGGMNAPLAEGGHDLEGRDRAFFGVGGARDKDECASAVLGGASTVLGARGGERSARGPGGRERSDRAQSKRCEKV